MPPLNRRNFIAASAVSATAGLAAVRAQGSTGPGNLHLGTFRFDVTPPMGHSLCGGWISPVVGVDDPLEAIGYVLLGAGEPIVVCVVDWTGLLNSAHLAWRQALADAAGTTIERVTVHCVHQHNAPFACLEAGRTAVGEALQRTTPVTHVAHHQAPVEMVASNRRIIGLTGKVQSQRGSSSKREDQQVFPEGLIDPMLKTVAFYNQDTKLVASHYYACHPMSYYGDGRVSSDFCGLARKQRQAEEPHCMHLYFNGCGGNIGAGKYNDGSKAMRPVLRDRMYRGMVASEEKLDPQSIESLSWETQDILPLVNTNLAEDALMRQISDHEQSVVNRNRPAYALAWLRRIAKGHPITLSSLHVNDISLLHLPSESFIEYQLRAQASAPGRFVACAAYGDGGPWYIPTSDAYPQGGYAVSVAWCAPDIDPTLSGGISELLTRVESPKNTP